MPANSRAIQSGAALSTVTEFHNIIKDAIRYGWHLKLQTKKYNKWDYNKITIVMPLSTYSKRK